MGADGVSRGKVSRRTFLAGAAGAGAGLAVGAAAGVGGERSGVFASDDDAATAQSVAFWGEHQAGIATPAQDRLQFAALDLTTTRRQDVADLMRAWTEAASRMCAGDTAAALASDAAPPPADSGEAIGLAPARLTITFGFGPSLFSNNGGDRFGLASRRPAALIDLPAFPNDLLDPAKSGGDIAIQACADDPQVAFHAVRNLVRMAHARGGAALVSDGVRAHVVDEREPGDAAKPDGVQGRHEQHQGRRHRVDASSSSGPATKGRRGCAAGATWSRAASTSGSKRGTATRSATRRRASDARR